MNLDQLVYASEQNSLRKFVLNYILPYTFLITTAMAICFYLLSILGFIPPELFLPTMVLSPILGVAAVFLILYLGLSSKQSDIMDNLPLFVTFLGAIAVKEQRYSSFFKTVAENKGFGEISNEMEKVYNLAVYWKMGYAEACRVVAKISPSPLFAKFITRLSNTIEYGEDLGSYLISEQETLMNDIEINFQESIYFISTLTELFSALISAFAFLSIFVVLLPIFVDVQLNFLLYGMLGILIAFDAFFIFLAKSLLPRDELTHKQKHKSTEQIALFLLLPAAVIAVFAGSSVLFRFSNFPLSVNIALTFTPLLVIGYLAREQENTIKAREFSFMIFIRSLGEKAQMHRGSFEPIIDKMRSYHYEKLSGGPLNSLYKRLAIGTNIFTAWAFFLTECGSRLIHKFGGMFLQAIYLGADPKQVGDIIAGNLNRILQVRKLREKTSSGSIGEVYGAFVGIAMAMFITAGLAMFLFNVFSGFELEKSEAVPGMSFMNFSRLDVGPIEFFMVLMTSIHAAFSAVFIKMLDGGMLIGAFIHFAIMLWIMVAVDFGVKITFSMITMKPA